MTRSRATVIGGLVVSWLLVMSGPASAHGLGGRLDLPVPIWLFVYGAAAVVLISFVALGILWKDPRLEGRISGRPFGGAVQRVLRGGIQDLVVRVLSVFFFGVVFIAAAAGHEHAFFNIAPWWVYIGFWVGFALVHALLGNWWATLSPWDSIARFLGIGEKPRRPYPVALGVWPAAILLLGFLTMELVIPNGDSPRVLAWAIGIYSAVTLGGMAMFGRDEWNRSGEAFAVYFGLLSRIAPLARDEEGRVIRRPLLSGLPQLQPRPGLVAIVMIVIGSTTFDGFSGTRLWTGWTNGLAPLPRGLAFEGGLLGTILLAAAVYALSMTAASAVAGTAWHPLSVRFVHTLVPIAFAYITAHYFSLLLLEGQTLIALISDPFGFGWNLFGTISYAPNLTLLSPEAIWYVQVGVIVLGHVAGVALAHDRALASFPKRVALKTQYAFLGVMVLFTMSGLLILRG